MTRPRFILVAAWLVAAGACHIPDYAPGSMVGAATEDSARIERATADYGRDVDVRAVVGLRHPPFPGVVEQLAMSIVTVPDEPAARATWTVTSARVEARPVLLLSRVLTRTETPILDDDGRRIGTASAPTFEIVDAVPLPPLLRGERLVLFGCADRSGRHVFPYIEWDIDLPVMRDPRMAWSLDQAGGRLEVVDAIGVTCRNPRFPDG